MTKETRLSRARERRRTLVVLISDAAAVVRQCVKPEFLELDD